jgi:hypothetical protein
MRRRWASLIIAAILALTAALVVVIDGASAPDTTAAGLHAGGLYICPQEFPYAAYWNLKRVYAPGYPGQIPRATRPVCYASASAATGAGYALERLPPKQTRVGPVYFISADPSVTNACRHARRTVGYGIDCPGVLPAQWVAQRGCPRAQCRVFRLNGQFSTAPDYVGTQPGLGFIAVWAVPAWGRPTSGVLCAGELRATRTTVRGHRGSWLSCPAVTGASTGEIGLRWREGSVYYSVYAGGDSDVNRQLVLYVASHLVRLPPTRRSAAALSARRRAARRAAGAKAHRKRSASAGKRPRRRRGRSQRHTGRPPVSSSRA